MTITAQTISEQLKTLTPEKVEHPAIRRLIDRLRSEDVVLGIYSRMHHRHNRSLNG